MKPITVIFGPVLMAVAAWVPFRSLAAAEPSSERQQSWIEIGSEKAVIARHSKSADGRHALAWTIKAGDPIDWTLLDTDADRFYEKYDLKEMWVVDVPHASKLGTLSDAGGYVRPGSHRTLSVAWAPLENGRRFALAAYDWKWGTDTLILLDVGTDDCRHAQIESILNQAVEGHIKKSARSQSGPFDTRYVVASLPELGKKTGFFDSNSVGLPFTSRNRSQDAAATEGVLTLKLARSGTGPTVSVVKVTPGPLPDDSFTDATRLAKADKELNAVYATLREKLEASESEKLKIDQRAWIEQRDQKADQAVRDKSSAESGRIVRDRVLRDLTEQRTTELRDRLQRAK